MVERQARVMSPTAEYDEVPVFFTSGRERLFGILTRPRREINGAVALLLWGSGALPSFGPNQVRARLARRLAGQGYHAVRMDYLGVGDSTGTEPPGDKLDDPNLEPVRAAVTWLRQRGLTRTVLVGSCFGARTALASVGTIPDVAAVALISPPVWDDEDDPKPGENFLAPLAVLCQRGTPVLFLYGQHDHVYKHFRRGQAGDLGQLLEQAGSSSTISVVDDFVHGFPTVSGGDRTIDIVDEWLSVLPSRPPAVLLQTPALGVP